MCRVLLADPDDGATVETWPGRSATISDGTRADIVVGVVESWKWLSMPNRCCYLNPAIRSAVELPHEIEEEA